MAQPTYSFPDYWGEADLDVLPDDGHRYEIVDGSLLATPPPLDGHQGIGVNLLVTLRSVMPSGWRVLYEIGVRVPGGNFIPDVVVLRPGAARDVEWRESEDVALVIEVASRSTRVTDRTLKAAKYAEAGIASYWRVDADGTVTIHTAPADDEYTHAAVVRPGERVLIEQPFPVDLVPADLVD
ncbi:Uma2 family endonuclease [Tsukamurella paurometabola]|uniref:Uma2 family endonuclease n=1 Tax=Tsukamurella paurometabola TaxID=2061 RepID=A0ABS5NAV9_TSUPA|nr:Uma2 family endonuclease [Tsukamurella paurometabola]MBS4101402.1 Uma2 family endonuclease [Tsukamurella paurometabola]